MNKDEIKSVKNNVVTKSNILIEANYKLTIIEQKIILFIVSKIRKDDEDFARYKLSVKDFYELLGYKGTPKYSEMREITKKLMGKILEIKEGGKLTQVSWLSFVEYNKTSGSVSLSFDPNLKPYLLQLKREFTSYKLKNIMELKNSYSIRIYEILKKWQTVKQVEIPLEKLRKMVGVNDKYREYHNFKKRVLIPSQKEVKNKTDISFEYEEIKHGRKVIAILFLINSKSQDTKKLDSQNNNQSKTEDESWLDSLFIQLDILFKKHNYDLNKDVVKRWVGQADKIWGNNKYIKVNELSNQAFRKEGIQNHIAFISHILKEKVRLLKEGKDHNQASIETYSPPQQIINDEVVPDWFKERQKKRKEKNGL
ncbi:replication initiation protein [Virgibacillus sp. DJP39]|uniref:replication initiation protein n=1 Tax=Virgibacillus sp. DJP39 TaxID=3409790 RepID=UPI003BB644F2